MSVTKIATVTVGGAGAASVAFTAVPSTFTDLIIVIAGRSALSGSNYMTIAINGSTSTFSVRGIFGSGSTTGSFTTPANYAGENAVTSHTANTFGSTSIYIPNYAGSTNKSYSGEGVGETNASQAFQAIFAGLWSTSSAINSVSLTPISTTWLEGTTATLYGVTKGTLAGVTVS